MKRTLNTERLSDVDLSPTFSPKDLFLFLVPSLHIQDFFFLSLHSA